MLNHSSAKQYEETPHVTKSIKNKKPNRNGRGARREGITHANKSTKRKALNLNGRPKKTNKKSVPGAVATGYQVARNTLTLNNTSQTRITNAVRRRARAAIRDRSIDAQSRVVIRYALETNDPWLPELVRRANAGETIIYTVNSLKHPHSARM